MPADFLAAAKAKEPAKLLTDWAPQLGIAGGFALDLGCGTGAEAAWLAQQGFAVDAIDKSPAMVAATKARCEGLKVNVMEGDFTQLNYEHDRYSLVTAINSLPFLKKDACKMLLEDVKESVRPGGGVIIGVYGVEHPWAEREDMSFWSREELALAWGDFQIVNLDEFKGEWPLLSGEKIFQHRIHLVAKKPQ